MKLKLLVGLSSGQQPGDCFETDDTAEAGRMIASRFAVPWSEVKIERAVKPPAPEKRKAK